MTRCDWAACTAPATQYDGEFHHCTQHYRDHLAFEREDSGRLAKYDPKRDTRRQVVGLHRDGYGTRQIAAALGVTANRVNAIKRAVGIADERQAS